MKNDKETESEVESAMAVEETGDVLRTYELSLTTDLVELMNDINSFGSDGKRKFAERFDNVRGWAGLHKNVQQAKLDEVIELARKTITEQKPSERMVDKVIRDAIEDSVQYLKKNARDKKVTDVPIDAVLCLGAQEKLKRKANELLQRYKNPPPKSSKTAEEKQKEADDFEKEFIDFQVIVEGEEKQVVLSEMLADMLPDITKIVEKRYSSSKISPPFEADRVASFYVHYALFTEYFKSMKLLYQVLLKEYEELDLLDEKVVLRIRRSAVRRIAEKLAKARWKGLDGAEQRAEFRSDTLRDIRTAVHERRDGAGDSVPIAALCLSGGGIRSATFSLGVIQALAKFGMLDKFDYLSTVSGGGYIGSWLSAWIRRTTDKDGRHKVSGVQKMIASREVGEPEPPQVTYLRSYSNFLSPRLGLGSADTWALIGTFLRNLLLNWTVVIPLAAMICLIPQILTEIIRNGDDWVGTDFSWTATIVMSVAVACGVVATFASTIFRPSVSRLLKKGSWFDQKYRPDDIGMLRSVEPKVVALCVLPMLVFAIGATTYWSWGMHGERLYTLRNLMAFITDHKLFQPIYFIVVGFFVAALVLNLIYRRQQRAERGWDVWFSSLLFVACIASSVLQNTWFQKNALIFGMVSWAELVFIAGFVPARIYVWVKSQKSDRPKAVESLASEFSISYLAATLGGLLMYAISRGAQTLNENMSGGAAASAGIENEQFAHLYTVFAVPIFLLIYLLSGTLFVGIGSKLLDDEDREWLSRAGAWLLMIAVGWTVFFGLILSTRYVIDMLPSSFNWWSPLIASVGGIAGVITLLFGFFARSSTDDKPAGQHTRSRIFVLLPIVAAPLFVACLVVGLVWATAALMIEVGNRVTYLNILNHEQGESVIALLLWMACFAVVGLFMGFWVNINKFSLHAIYRDRIIRAYLGASRGLERLASANSFTNMDENDNFSMVSLGGQRPFHVINIALNLANSTNLRWQNRKAESFTVTPFHCGSSNMGEGTGNYRSSKLYGADKLGRPISLGTAIAISGAAASPNMGYFTQSAPVSALMALFNIRLGWWLGNPGRGGRNTYRKNAPDFAPLPMANEALGRTGDTNPFVYLSDGGHFENLGLYEMVLRRCKFIVVCDSGADGTYSYSDLATAIHKIRVDMGVSITFERDQCPSQKRYCAIGTVGYTDVDGDAATDGVLIYLKPTLTSDEPIDISNYKTRSPKFPHESTGDQMYSESQFESYRLLGFHIMDTICDRSSSLKRDEIGQLRTLRANAEDYLQQF
ncbi:MAG: patatin-like phospholipase family protein [Pyrinomonadaceae bacterium]